MKNCHPNLIKTIYRACFLAVVFCFSVVAQTNLPATPPPSGMTAWYPSDGNAIDIQSGVNGALSGSAAFTTTANGKAREAFSFDAANNSYVEIPHNSTNNSNVGTWEFWFKTPQPDTTNGAGLVGKHDSLASRNGITIFLNVGQIGVQIKSGGDTLSLGSGTGGALNDNQFHHVALTYQSGGASNLYLDGKLVDSGSAPNFAFNPNPVRIGKMLDNYWDAYSGAIDEFAIYNRVLQPHEIRAIYNSGANGKQKPIQKQLLLVSNFNGNVGTPGSVSRLDAETGENLGLLVAQGSGGLASAGGIYFDSTNNVLYVTSFATNQIKKYNAATGAYLGDLANGAGNPNGPGTLLRGADGKLYVTCYNDNRVLRYDLNTQTFDSVFVAAGSGGMSQPTGIGFGPDGNFYVASRGTNQILKYDGATGAFLGVFAANGLNQPSGIVFRPDGFLYANNFGSSQIVRFNAATGAFVDVFASRPQNSTSGEGIAFDGDGNLIAAASSANFGGIERYSGTSGAFLQTLLTGTSPIAPLLINAPCLNPPAGLVAFYTADGTAEDAVGTNEGELKNGAFYGVGKAGSAAFGLDGVDDTVEAADNPALNFGAGDFTAEAWIKWNGSQLVQNREYGVINKNATYQNSSGWGFELSTFGSASGGSAYIVFYNTGQSAWGNTNVQTPNPVAGNVWYHVVGVRQGNTLSLYVNGSLVQTKTSADAALNVDNNQPLIIGDHSWGLNFPGQIDEVSLYNAALSATAVQSVYSAGKGGKCKPAATANELSLSVANTNAYQNAYFTFTATITNHGSQTANNVIINGVLPANLNFISADAGCAFDAQTRIVSCEITSIAPNFAAKSADFAPTASVSRNIVVQPTAQGALTAPFTVTAFEADPAISNNFFASNVNVLAPTAAVVTLSGKIMSADGRGIRNALVTLTETNGNSRTVLTGAFGNYRFAEIAAGQTVIVSVAAKRYAFEPPVQAIFLNENMSEVNFSAQ